MPKFETDPEPRSFEDLCLHAQLLLEDVQNLPDLQYPVQLLRHVNTLQGQLSRLVAQFAELAQNLAMEDR